MRSVRFGKKRKAAKERDAEALDDNSQKDNAMKERETCAALFMAPPPNLDVLVEGINVWVYYPSDDSYYQGTITRRNEDSTFEVSFLDGDEDEAVNPANLRVCPPPVIIHRGMRIRARRKAGEPLESGTVERFVKDGVYKVRFDSGRVESVSRALMEVVHLGPDDRFEYEAELSTHDGLGMSFGKTENNRILVTGFQKLRNGKRGEAEKSGMIHIKDEILSINGTSVEGLTLQQVAEIIRAGGGKINLKLCRKGPTVSRFSPGDYVEALFAQETEWFCGIVLDVHEDSTLDIRYDDGEIERNVKPHLVRHVLPVGSTVLVRYAGISSDSFEGTVSQINGDGTYMIRYKDNDEERVPREWLSPAEPDEDEVSVISDADSTRESDLAETLLLARRAADKSGDDSSSFEVPQLVTPSPTLPSQIPAKGELETTCHWLCLSRLQPLRH